MTSCIIYITIISIVIYLKVLSCAKSAPGSATANVTASAVVSFNICLSCWVVPEVRYSPAPMRQFLVCLGRYYCLCRNIFAGFISVKTKHVVALYEYEKAGKVTGFPARAHEAQSTPAKEVWRHAIRRPSGAPPSR